jgi:hypothetical protein
LSCEAGEAIFIEVCSNKFVQAEFLATPFCVHDLQMEGPTVLSNPAWERSSKDRAERESIVYFEDAGLAMTK